MDVYAWALGADVGVRVVYGERPVEGHAWVSGTALSNAWRASQEGLVFLAQRRVRRAKGDPGVVRYEATRISRPTAELLRLVERAR
jgi:hypothetical protein